jgi:hypothetical protein
LPLASHEQEADEGVAVDLSFPQLACTELKCAAIRQLDYEDVLAFLGVRPSAGRLKTYAAIRGELSDAAREYWDANRVVIARGLIHGGKLEAYFRTFRTRVLPFMHTKDTVGRMLQEKTEGERVSFYRGMWDNARWRFLFQLFFGRFIMGRHGRDARRLQDTRYRFPPPHHDQTITGFDPLIAAGRHDPRARSHDSDDGDAMQSPKLQLGQGFSRPGRFRSDIDLSGTERASVGRGAP